MPGSGECLSQQLKKVLACSASQLKILLKEKFPVREEDGLFYRRLSITEVGSWASSFANGQIYARPIVLPKTLKTLCYHLRCVGGLNQFSAANRSPFPRRAVNDHV